MARIRAYDIVIGSSSLSTPEEQRLYPRAAVWFDMTDEAIANTLAGNDMSFADIVEDRVADILDVAGTDEYIVSLKFDRRKDVIFCGVVSFTVGEVDRVWGGPEEGGWYWDRFTPERVFHVRADKADRLERRLQRVVDRKNEGRRELSSVLSDGRTALRKGAEGRTPRPIYC